MIRIIFQCLIYICDFVTLQNFELQWSTNAVGRSGKCRTTPRTTRTTAVGRFRRLRAQRRRQRTPAQPEQPPERQGRRQHLFTLERLVRHARPRSMRRPRRVLGALAEPRHVQVSGRSSGAQLRLRPVLCSPGGRRLPRGQGVRAAQTDAPAGGALPGRHRLEVAGGVAGAAGVSCQANGCYFQDSAQTRRFARLYYQQRLHSH